MRVSWDDEDGEHDTEGSASVVRARVRALDGDARTYVSLGDPDNHLMCGGDAGRGVVVYVQRGDINEQLVSGGGDDSVEVVVAGGQPGDYPSRFVVPVESAEKAALHFLSAEEPDDGLAWERQW